MIVYPLSETEERLVGWMSLLAGCCAVGVILAAVARVFGMNL